MNGRTIPKPLLDNLDSLVKNNPEYPICEEIRRKIIEDLKLSAKEVDFLILLKGAKKFADRKQQIANAIDLILGVRQYHGNFPLFLQTESAQKKDNIEITIKAQETPFLIDGRKVIGVLGRGGMGITFLVENMTLARETKKGSHEPRKEAMKCILPHEIQEATFAKKRFFAEAGNAAAVEHPNAVRVYAFTHIRDEQQDYPVIFSEYIEGKDASELFPYPILDRHGKKVGLSAKAALLLMTEILQGVKAVHEKRLIHLDLKFENILIRKNVIDALEQHALDNAAASGKKPFLTQKDIEEVFDAVSKKKEGWALVSDLGVSEADGKEKIPPQGTAKFMAPEMYREPDGITASPAQDVYAFGVMLYETITQRSVGGALQRSVLQCLMEEQSILHQKKQKTQKDQQRIEDIRQALERLRRFSSPSNLSGFTFVMNGFSKNATTIHPKEKRMQNIDKTVREIIIACTNVDPLKRPSLEDLNKKIEARILAMNRKRWPLIGSIMASVAAAVLTTVLVTPAIRPKTHIEHGAARKTAVAAAAEILKKSPSSEDELGKALQTLKALETPKEYKPDKDEPTDRDVDVQKKQIEAKLQFQKTCLQYHQGNTENLKTPPDGLNDEDRAVLEKMRIVAKTWFLEKSRFGKKVNELLQQNNPDAVSAFIEECAREAEKGDRTAFSKLLLVKNALYEAVSQHIRQSGAIGSQKERLGKNPKIQTFRTLIRKALFAIVSVNPDFIPNPGDFEKLQSCLVQKTEWLQEEINHALKVKKNVFPLAEELIKTFAALQQFYDQHGQIGAVSENDKRTLPTFITDKLREILRLAIQQEGPEFKQKLVRSAKELDKTGDLSLMIESIIG